jgi:hypothetical protein
MSVGSLLEQCEYVAPLPLFVLKFLSEINIGAHVVVVDERGELFQH